jgi:hypothetical protein
VRSKVSHARAGRHVCCVMLSMAAPTRRVSAQQQVLSGAPWYPHVSISVKSRGYSSN